MRHRQVKNNIKFVAQAACSLSLDRNKVLLSSRKAKVVLFKQEVSQRGPAPRVLYRSKKAIKNDPYFKVNYIAGQQVLNWAQGAPVCREQGDDSEQES